MKRTLPLFISPLLISFCALLSACSENSNKGDQENPIIELQSYQFDAIAQLTDSLSANSSEGENYWRVRGQGMMPKRIGDIDISALRDTLAKVAQIIIVNENLTEPALENDLLLTKKDPKDTEACSVMVNELSTDLVTPQLIVWKDYAYSYPCGAAHGTYDTEYINYSIPLKKILRLEDIFAPNYESALENVIREKLSEENVTLLVDLNEVKISSDFRLSTHSIDFIYGLYEIAPYSEGEIVVSIPRYEIDSLFAPGMEKILFGPSFD